MSEKYTIEHKTVENILGFIRAEEIAIPEIQRPFVWSATQVRNLIDSLYKGYPAGYLIVWQNPDVKLKDGATSLGKKILIDGQQRVTAIMTAIDGLPVLRDDYTTKQIKIAFNPWAQAEEPSFEVQTPIHLKDKKWIPDISLLFKSDFDDFEFAETYAENNPGINRKEINAKVKRVKDIVNRQIGVIMLDPSLDINEVTEIFVRINSQGKVLNEADFAMSKIAADDKFGGNLLRKAIDYFCHLAVDPTFWTQVTKDGDFMSSPFAERMKWLASDNKEIYDPDYSDMLRVSLMHKFNRGKLKDLVSLLSGRDFTTRTFVEEIREQSFTLLTDGIRNFIGEYQFQQFVQAIETAGFISPRLLRSQMTLDFAYTLYLILHERCRDWGIRKEEIGRYVQKWFVLSTLTGRYSGSPESVMDRDLRAIKDSGVPRYLADVEAAELGETFWNVGLEQALEKSIDTAPAFCVFTAAQVFFNDKSLFTETPVRALISNGDIHHLFPREYLKSNGFSFFFYNQVANYAYLSTPVNIAIGKKAPLDYFGMAVQGCTDGKAAYGTIASLETLKRNMADNCIPLEIVSMSHEDYESTFLPARRKLMAAKIHKYYESL